MDSRNPKISYIFYQTRKECAKEALREESWASAHKEIRSDVILYCKLNLE